MANKFSKHALANGVRVILVPRPEALATNILILAETGSKYELKDQNGISHFLEHLCFKGTKKRPKPQLISAGFDSLGAQFNAFTSQEYTGYYASVQPRLFDQALDLLADMYLNSTIPLAELDKERGVIIEEINMYEDMPQRQVQNIFLSLLYGDQPAGWDVIGTKDIIRSLTREDFLAYRNEHYVAGATVVVVAGPLLEATVLNKVKQQFKILTPQAKLSKLAVVESQTKPQTLVKFKKSDQTHLVLGFRALPANHPQNDILEVLTAVLGGSMSSRLFVRIREELGAAYYVRATNDAYTDHGVMQVAVGADNSRAPEIVKAILGECDKLKTKLVPLPELNRAKESLIGNLFLGLEKTSSLAGFYGEAEIVRGKLSSPEAIAKRLRAVTPAQIRQLARDLFLNERLNLALIGPVASPTPFERILRL